MPEELSDRRRIAKLVGALGGAEAERAKALAELHKALSAAGLTFGWLADVVERDELVQGDREGLFKELVLRQLRGGLTWASFMGAGEPARVREVIVAMDNGRHVGAIEIKRAIEIVDVAVKRSR